MRVSKLRIMIFIFFFSSFNFIPYSFAARPLSTDDAGTVDKGHYEIETGLEYVNQADREVALSLVIKRGMLDNLDLGVEVPYKFINFAAGSKTDGFDDIKISSKFNFLEEKNVLPAMSVSLVLKTDSGNDDKSLGTGEKEYQFNTIMSKSLNNLTLHFNFGYTIKDDLPEQDLRDILTYGVAVEYPFNDKLNLVGEIVGENERRGDFDDNPMAGIIGFNYSLDDNVMYDLGLSFEISEASPDFKVTTGLTFGF